MKLRLEPAATALAALLLAASFVAPALPWPQRLYDHVVVLDVTQSMNVVDQPFGGRPLARLEAAKRALRDALDALPCGSRVGWAIFTEYRSYLLLAPLEVCANRAELRATLAAIDNRMAWSGNSEVAKGLHSALVIARALPDKPSLVFVTDGHEAPPLDPRLHPRYDDDKPGEVAGLVLGVGGLRPQPIPKTDPSGRAVGVWKSDEVLHSDPRTRVDVDSPARGSEHLSALREAHLQRLAREHGLAYRRLGDDGALADALRAPAFARTEVVDTEGRVPLAAAALLCLLAPHLRRRR